MRYENGWGWIDRERAGVERKRKAPDPLGRGGEGREWEERGGAYIEGSPTPH